MKHVLTFRRHSLPLWITHFTSTDGIYLFLWILYISNSYLRSWVTNQILGRKKRKVNLYIHFVAWISHRFYLFIGVWALCVVVCMWVGGGQCAPVCTWRAEENVVSCFITFLPYPLETGSATVSGARPAASNPGNPPVQIPTGLGLHAYAAVPRFLDYSHWGFLSYWAIMPASHKFQMKNKHLFSSGDHIKIDCHVW